MLCTRNGRATDFSETGGLFKLIVRLMQLFTEFKGDLVPLVDTLGYLFQIRDDYCNLCVQEVSENALSTPCELEVTR